MVLPKSFKQFRLGHLMMMTALLAVAFAAWTGWGLAGKSLAVCISGYCAGIGMSFLSDVIDDAEMDDRKASSQVLSTPVSYTHLTLPTKA